MLQHSVLQRDLLTGQHSLNHQTASDEEWTAWWREWPIGRWLDSQNGNRWFRLKGNTFQFDIECPAETQSQLEAMTEELVEWRLAAYSKSRRLTETADSEVAFEAKVSHANGRPILFLPDRSKLPSRPVGLVTVKLPDSSDWEFKFVKIACNVAKPLASNDNELSSLLKSWFGPNAGLPGTDFKVQFESKDGQWSARPLDVPLNVDSIAQGVPPTDIDESVIEYEIPKRAEFRTHVPVYDLVAAAGGWGEPGAPEQVGWMKVNGQSLSKDMFVARVTGDSMTPKIPNGSWCLFRSCPAGSRQNRLLLVQVNTHADPFDGGRYTVKKYRSMKSVQEDGWEHQTITLEPLNPDRQPIEIHAEEASGIRVIGEFVDVVAAI